MATITSATALTIADLANRTTAKGKIDPQIIEILGNSSEILDDALWLECNDGTGHKTTVRSGLPTGTWRLLNYGVQPEKSKTVQIRDTCGMLETYSEVDAALVDMAKDKAAFRMSEDKGFIEGLNQTMMYTMFKGDTGLNPEKFMGLEARYAKKSGVESGDNIISGGGSGSTNTSIWLVTWGPDALHMIYPEGTMAGLQVRDLGEETLTDAAGGKYQGFRTHYKWMCGMTLRDWRKVVRIANIDVANLKKDGSSSSADLIDLMTVAIETLPAGTSGKMAFYCNRTIRSYLRRQIANKGNVWLSMEEVAGKKVVAFDGIPVRRVDCITNTEATIA